MYAIVSVDSNWGIGYQGNLLQKIPEDMAFFKATTTGHTVIMGRETMTSLPRQAPLPDRVNIVLSRKMPETLSEMSCAGTEAATRASVSASAGFYVCPSLDRLFHELARYEDRFGETRKFVIGGESVYRQLLPFCHTAYVTKFARAYTADRHFPNLDQDPAWCLGEESEARAYQGLEFRFTTYRRQA